MNEEFNFHMLLRWKSFSNCCFADMCWELLVEQLAIIFRVLVLLVNIFFVCQCWYYRWSWDCRVNYLMKARKYAETCRSVKLKLKLFFKLCWSGRVINLMHYVSKFDVNEIIVFDSVIVITIAPQLTFGADHCRDWSCRIAVLTPSNNASTFPRSHPSAHSRRVWAVWCRCTPATQVHRVPERKCCGTPKTSWTSTSPPSDGQYILTYSECILRWTSTWRFYEPYWRHVALIWINRLNMQWR